MTTIPIAYFFRQRERPRVTGAFLVDLGVRVD